LAQANAEAISDINVQSVAYVNAEKNDWVARYKANPGKVEAPAYSVSDNIDPKYIMQVQCGNFPSGDNFVPKPVNQLP